MSPGTETTPVREDGFWDWYTNIEMLTLGFSPVSPLQSSRVQGSGVWGPPTAYLFLRETLLLLTLHSEQLDTLALVFEVWKVGQIVRKMSTSTVWRASSAWQEENSVALSAQT